MNSEASTNAHYIGNRPPLEILSTNKILSSRLASLLPPGTDVKEAASGFKKLEQFVAALHVSHDLGIPFDELKSKLVGKSKESLGKAIAELSPDANSKAEVKKVNKQTEADLSGTSEPTAS
jgi:hypothetical protein